MPKKYKLTYDERIFAFSEAQYLMLSRKKIKVTDPLEWKFEQRMSSLVKQGLFRKWNGSFERTKLGLTVYDAIHDRISKSSTSKLKE